MEERTLLLEALEEQHEAQIWGWVSRAGLSGRGGGPFVFGGLWLKWKVLDVGEPLHPQVLQVLCPPMWSKTQFVPWY